MMKPYNLRISILSEALKVKIETESARSKFTETGGVIAGTGSIATGKIQITHASLPGPKAQASRYTFNRDSVFCQNFLDKLASNSNGRIDYLGEWHKHFEITPIPSYKDKNALFEIAESPYYHVNQPLLLIIGNSNKRRSLRVFITHEETRRLILVDWEEFYGKKEEEFYDKEI